MNSKTSPKRNDQRLRKVAILVDSLDPSSADSILEQMNAETAARVRSLVMGLNDVSQSERDEVLSEFLSRESDRGSAGPTKSSDVALELSPAAQVAAQTVASQPPFQTYSSFTIPSSPGQTPHSPSPIAGEHRRFEFLEQVEPKVLADVLEEENAQAIAVVLSHLPPEFCSEVISFMGPDLQAEVMRRLFELDVMDETVLEELETHFRAQVSEHLQLKHRRKAGLATIAAILRATDDHRRGRLMSVLEQKDFELVSQIDMRSSRTMPPQRSFRETSVESSSENAALDLLRQRGSHDSGTPHANQVGNGQATDTSSTRVSAESHQDEENDIQLAFDDLEKLDDDSLLRVFKGLSQKIAIPALAGAESSLIDRLLQHVPKREARAIRKKIDRAGPIRLADIAKAQQHITAVAIDLFQEDRITIPSSIVERSNR